MGIYEEEKFVANEEGNKIERKRTGATCLWSFLVSMTGGLVLGLWEYEYHPTNSQQWMVPLGLILFVTPVIAWFAFVLSDETSNSEDCQQVV